MTCDYWSRHPELPLPWWFIKFGYEDTVSFDYRTKVRMAKIKHFVWKINPWRKEVRMVSNFEYVPHPSQIALPKPPPTPPRPFFPVPLYPVNIYPAGFNPASWPSGMPWPKPRIRMVSVPIDIPTKDKPAPDMNPPPPKPEGDPLDIYRIPAPDRAYEADENGLVPWFN